MTQDLSFDVASTPERALTRVAVAINQRPKRAFGVLKTHNEYVGVVWTGGFEVWERSQRAVRAVGRVKGSQERTRIVVQFVIPPTTRVLLAIFFALYLVVALGISLQGPEPAVSPAEAGIAVAGAATLAALFLYAGRRQRSDLRAFLEGVFGDVGAL